MSHEIISHKGKQIIFADYSKCTTEEEVFELLGKSMDAISSSSEKARILINVDKVAGTREFQKKAKELGAASEGKVFKRAVIGVTGIKKVLLMGFNKFAKSGKAVPFDTKEEALEFLAAD